VPPEVHKLSMIVVGGAGGRSDGNVGGGPGGVSGLAYARFAVTPGEELTIWVGGEGRPFLGGEGVSWGWSCGAAGGEGEGLTAENGGGGGASSAVTLGTESAVADCTTRPPEDRLLIVGGGGGGGGASNFVPPPEPGVAHGGYGGSGGNPAGAGGQGTYIAPGGCGGCTPFSHSQAGAPNVGNGSGGGPRRRW
jgi:hypothetical protein